MIICLFTLLIVLLAYVLQTTAFSKFSNGLHSFIIPSTRNTINHSLFHKPFMKSLKYREIFLSSTMTTLPSLNRCEEYAAYLRKGQRWGGSILGPIVRFLNNCTVGLIFTIILRVLNRFEVIRQSDMFELIFNRTKNIGLLTVSNHQSIQDDPGLWAALLPWWKLRTDKFRWVLCTEDVFFYRKWLQSILAAGNVMPLDRSGSLEQPLFEVFKEKLESGAWCHIFPEGRIWQSWRFEKSEPHLGPFKIGVGKLIAHSKVIPIVLPFYHTGMDDIVPEKQLTDKKSRKPAKPQSIFPQRGKHVKLYVGKPIDFKVKVAKFKEEHPNALSSWYSTAESIALYTEIANDIRIAVLELEKEARGRNRNA